MLTEQILRLIVSSQIFAPIHVQKGVRTFHPMQFQPLPFQPLTISTYCIFNLRFQPHCQSSTIYCAKKNIAELKKKFINMHFKRTIEVKDY